MGAYIILGNGAWRSLENGKQYVLTMQFDEEVPWKGPALATDMGLVIKFSKANFLVEFARKQNLSIWYGNRLVTRLPLTGSKDATNEMVVCQHKIDAAKNATLSDPFAQRTPSDPFSSAAQSAPVQLDPFRQ
jgi:hypothetical protein